MALGSGLFTSTRGTWRTPKKLYRALKREFRFTSDVTPPNHRRDSLRIQWRGRVYANPPYGRKLYRWTQHAYEQGAKGCTIVMLLPARTDTAWFHDHCLKASEIRFLRGRLYFDDGGGRAPFPSMIIIWRGVKR